MTIESIKKITEIKKNEKDYVPSGYRLPARKRPVHYVPGSDLFQATLWEGLFCFVFCFQLSLA